MRLKKCVLRVHMWLQLDADDAKVKIEEDIGEDVYTESPLP